MAGENVLPLTKKGFVSIHWTVPNNRAYAKGDIIEFGATYYGGSTDENAPAGLDPDTHAFLLNDVPVRSRNEQVEVCVSCDLVQIVKPNDEVWPSGTHITWDETDGPTRHAGVPINRTKVGQFIGVVERDAALADEVAYLVFRGAWI